jgi:hypothetical protein
MSLMLWNSRSKNEEELRTASVEIAFRKSKAEQLAEVSSPLDRMRMCAAWQDKARGDWYEGQRRQILAILESRDLRYRGMNSRVRQAIGERLWATSMENKDLAGAEAMYGRWVLTYEAQARAEGLIR